jgi:hypothetical protein
MIIKRNIKLQIINTNEDFCSVCLKFLFLVLCALIGLESSELRAQSATPSAVLPSGSKHALIIAIGKYENPQTSPLLGVKHDILSAKKMAAFMGVGPNAITILQNEQATLNAIKSALSSISSKTLAGDKIFIYFSGHGTRFKDESAGGCVEALLAYDGGVLTNSAMAELLQSMSQRADKVLVFYDACHSGGVLGSRPLTARSNESRVLSPLVAKFSPAIDASCNVPVNIRTRTLSAEVVKKGTLPNDIVHISSSAHNEVSFDDEKAGGLATQYFRDCLLGDAKDLDKSGAISVDEIRVCAQQKVNERLVSYDNLRPHNYQLSGNTRFVPAWFNLSSASFSNSVLPTNPAMGPVEELSQEDALRQVFDQRNAKTVVTASLDSDKLFIGEDFLGLKVTSETAGYVYVALLGSDAKSLYLIFPNEIDQENRINANETLSLPRSNWRLRSVGPPGSSSVLVIVSSKPRNFSNLSASKIGPFVTNLNDSSGRARLGGFLATSGDNATVDSFGAYLLRFSEIVK